MYEFTRKTICDGVSFGSIKDSRFKRSRINATLVTPLDKKTAAADLTLKTTTGARFYCLIFAYTQTSPRTTTQLPQEAPIQIFLQLSAVSKAKKISRFHLRKNHIPSPSKDPAMPQSRFASRFEDAETSPLAGRIMKAKS